MTKHLRRSFRLLNLIKFIGYVLLAYCVIYLVFRGMSTSYSALDDSSSRHFKVYYFLDDKRTWVYDSQNSFPEVVASRYAAERFLKSLFTPLVWLERRIIGNYHGFEHQGEQEGLSKGRVLDPSRISK